MGEPSCSESLAKVFSVKGVGYAVGCLVMRIATCIKALVSHEDSDLQIVRLSSQPPPPQNPPHVPLSYFVLSCANMRPDWGAIFLRRNYTGWEFLRATGPSLVALSPATLKPLATTHRPHRLHAIHRNYYGKSRG